MKYLKLSLLIIILTTLTIILAQEETATPIPPPANSVVIVPEAMLRSGPSVGYVAVGALTENSLLYPTNISEDGLWVLVEYRGGFGWIRRDLAFWGTPIDELPVLAIPALTPTSVPTEASTPLPFATATPAGDYVLTNAVNVLVRSGPGRNYARIGRLYPGTVVEPVSVDESGDWVLIRYSDRIVTAVGFGVTLAPSFDGYAWVSRPLVAWRTDLSTLPVMSQDNLTPSPTPLISLTPSATPTHTSTATQTPSATATPTETSTSTHTATATETATNTAIPTETATNTSTNTPVPTETATSTATNTEIPTETATEAATNTAIPTETATNTSTNTAVPTETATNTDVPTETPTETSIPTETETTVPTSTHTATNTDVPTETPTDEATSTPTEEIAVALVATTQPSATSETSVTPDPSATPESSPTSEPSPTDPPTQTATNEPSPTTEASATTEPTEQVVDEQAQTEQPQATLVPVVISDDPVSGSGRLPIELIIGGLVILLAVIYILLYIRGQSTVDRYINGAPIKDCPVCGDGVLTVDTRIERSLGIPNAKHLIRCNKCRSTLRETDVRQWRYAVDRSANPQLYMAYNNRTLSERELLNIHSTPLPSGKPVQMPEFSDEDTSNDID